MKVIVCIKQVPETTEVKIDSETKTLIREGVPSIINPFDMYAIEEGIRIREKYGGKVTVVSMGPPQVESALRQCIALGVDEVVLISDRIFGGSDTLATSYTLSQAVRKINEFDLIICGKQASDGDTAQVGPGIAQHLNIPFVTYVKKIEQISPDKSYIRVEKHIDEGYEVIDMPLPSLITVVKEINEPRVESLIGKMKAKKAIIPRWSADDLNVDVSRVGLNGSPTQVITIFTPPPRGKGEIFEGESEVVANKLIEKLKTNRII